MRLAAILVWCVSFANAQQPAQPAQPAKTSGSAPATKAPAKATTKTTQAFVPLPEDINCSFLPPTLRSGTEGSGWTISKVGGLACRITTGDSADPATAPPPGKEVTLTGLQSSETNPFTKQPVTLTTIVDGVLATKDFGDFKVTMRGSGFTIGIRPSRLRAFREFLSKQ
jgi:hypothetical protein